MSSQLSDPSSRRLSPGQRSVEAESRFSGPKPRLGDSVWLAFHARDRATVYVSGEVDIATVPQLTAAMSEALLADRDLTVDLCRVTFFGVSGLNAFAQAISEAHRAGRVLRVTGASETTRQLLQISGFDALLA